MSTTTSPTKLGPPGTWSQAEQDLYLRMSCTPVLDRLLAWCVHFGYDISSSEGICSRYEEYDAFMTRGTWANHPRPWTPPSGDRQIIMVGWPHDKPRTLVAVPEEAGR